MIQKFTCTDGTVYAFPKGYYALVDEVISLLEPHRGKLFWNGATDHFSFRADKEMVVCDEQDYQLGGVLDENEDLWYLMYRFLETDNEYGTEEEWLKQYQDADDEHGDYDRMDDE